MHVFKNSPQNEKKNNNNKKKESKNFKDQIRILIIMAKNEETHQKEAKEYNNKINRTTS
jgi:hypothetical protein